MRSIKTLDNNDWTTLLEAAKPYIKTASRSGPNSLGEAVDAIDNTNPRGLLMSDPMDSDESVEGEFFNKSSYT
jgi:hypothetical protein